MWANWVLAPLNLIDRNGAKIQHYRLVLDGGWGPGEFFAWLTSDIVYLLVVIPAAYSAQIVNFVVNPGTWLTPIEKAWTAVTNTLFAFISPTILLAAVFLAALVVIVFHARNADEALKAIVQRTVASLCMYALILVLLYNPAGTLRDVLTGWVGLVGGFEDDAAGVQAAASPNTQIPSAASGTHEVGDVITNGTDSSVLTNFLRPLTWMLNYGSQLSPDCAKQWTKLIELGQPMTCLTADQIQASQSTGTAFVMTVLALVPVFIYVRFAIVVLITFATHVILTIVRGAAAGAAAAASVWQDRPIDEFMRFMVSAIANLLVASAILTVARLGPAVAVSIAESMTDSTLVQFAVLVAAYHFLALAVWGLEKQFGPIRDWLLKAATNATPSADGSSRWWSLAFPGGLNPQATALDRVISRARERGSQWATQTREQVTKMANEKLLAGTAALSGAAAANLASAAATPGLVPDTPQSRAALAIVNTADDTHTETLSPSAANTVQTILTRLTPWRRTRTQDPTTAPLAMPASTHPDVIDSDGNPINHNGTSPDGIAQVLRAVPRVGTAVLDAPTQQIDTALPGTHGWRARLRHDANTLVARSAAQPELLAPLELDNEPAQAASTLTDPRGNALDHPGIHATPASYLARIAYMEIVMRAMGWQGNLDATELLPNGTTLFTSGLDEAGHWITEFHN